MSSALHLNKLPLLRRKPGIFEFNQMLELLPQAALLIDTRSGEIILGNSKACDLTKLSLEKLNGTELDEIIRSDRHDSDQNLETADSDRSILVQEDGTEVHIRLHSIDISPQNNWRVLTLEVGQESDDREIISIDASLHLKSHQILLEALNQSNLASALDLAIQAGSTLTGIETLAVYQAAGQDVELRNLASLGDELPARLPSQDLINLRNFQLWTSDSPPKSSLHRTVLEAGFDCLITIPIGQPNAVIGLLVAGDKQIPPGTHYHTKLQTLAGIITTIIQHFTLVQNLKQQLEVHNRFRKYIETAQSVIQDCLITLSKELRIIQLNRSAEQALGYSTEEARNFFVEDILVGTETLMPVLKIALQGVPTYNQENIRLYRRSGEAFLARVSTLPVKVEQEVVGVIILIQDLSEQEHIQAQAQQMEQHALLGEVMAIFAHEVRNPINNLSTGLQLMAFNLAPDDPNQEIITRLQNDCNRLEAHMKSILSFSRPADYEMEAVDIGVLISRMLERLRPRMTNINVQPHLQVTENTQPVQGNSRALEQVFTNLITNALHAMEEQGGTLAVKIQPGEPHGEIQYVEISVADSGPGIPEENIERIFQPFFTTKSSGTGLGLAITKRIVTSHKGNIGVETFPGGTVFTVRLPAYKNPIQDVQWEDEHAESISH